MNELYFYSLIPVLAVALLLFFSAALHGQRARGLAAYCLAVAAWSGSLLLSFYEPTAEIGQSLITSGGFVAAAYLHAAYDFTHQEKYGLVWIAYFVAGAITLLHMVRPGIIYDPVALQAGPLFAVVMGLAFVAATVPLYALASGFRDAARGARIQRLGLFAAGLLGYVGVWATAMTLASGIVVPVGNLIVLASLFVLAHVVRRTQSIATRRLMDRSLLYSAIGAFLFAGFIFAVLFMLGGGGLFPAGRLKAFFVILMAAVAFEPLRLQIQEALGRRLLRNVAHGAELAHELVDQEERASHAERLAEIGTLTTAVAHEVRNPLGVLSAHLNNLERDGVDGSSVATMREQISRAERFVEDLLRYGRPSRLALREVDLDATTKVAFTTARDGLGETVPDVELETSGFDDEVTVEADQGQLLDALVVLFDNALLALRGVDQPQLRVTVVQDSESVTWKIEDSGPGVPPELQARLFEPFVTGRKREGPRPGTGLGLAICRGIVERHRGSIGTQDSELGGAAFVVRLPRVQRLMAAAGMQ